MKQARFIPASLAAIPKACLSALEANFATTASVLRITCWFFVFLGGILVTASAIERQAELEKLARAKPAAEKPNTFEIQAFTPSELSVEELSARGAPKIVVIGASESTGFDVYDEYFEGIAPRLAKAFGKKGCSEVLVLDLAVAGLDLIARNRRIEQSVDYGADIIVLTTALHGAQHYFGQDHFDGPLFEGVKRDQREGGAPVPVPDAPDHGWTAPTRWVDKLLRQHITGYDAGFPHTFGRLLGTSEEIAVFSNELVETDESVRTIRMEWPRSNSQTDPPSRFTETMRQNPPKEPWERLHLLTAPALDAGVPVVYVITPVDRDDDYFERYVQFEAEFRTWDAQLHHPENGLHYYPAYKTDWEGAVTFQDAFHLKDSTAFVEALAGLILDEVLLARSKLNGPQTSGHEVQ